MLAWILNFAYSTLILLVSPVLAYRVLVLGKYRRGWSEKFLGNLPQSNGDCLWIHAVSVGEVLQIKSILPQLSHRYPDCTVLISTTTATGFDVAAKQYPEHQVCFFPLDFSWAVRRALKRVQPTAVVLVELEIWPNFIMAVERQGVPLGLINGRVSDNSFRGYQRLTPLLKKLWPAFRFIACQNELYASRFAQLGVALEQLRVTGSIKFDGVTDDRENSATCRLRELFSLDADEPIWVAGSTQAPEEEIVLSVYRRLVAEFPKLRLVLVPRHQERFDQVAHQISFANFDVIRRSHTEELDSRSDQIALKQQMPGPPPVILLDTLGELAACWGLADVAFVGGSLGDRGGQNMIEPAAYGAAVLFGPNTWNFREVVELLLTDQGARVVRDESGLLDAVRELLSDEVLLSRLGTNARSAVAQHRGAAEKTVSAIVQHLMPPGKTAAANPGEDRPTIAA